MSGHLGRMITAASAREPRLHPFAGSIYGQGRQSWAATPTARTDADAADPEQNLVVEVTGDAREADDRSRPRLTTQRRAPDVHNAAAAAADDYVPLYPQRRDNRPQPASRLSGPAEENLTAAQARPAELARDDGHTPGRRDGHAAADRHSGEATSRLHPLMVTPVPGVASRSAAIVPTAIRSTSRSAPRTADHPPQDIERALTPVPVQPRFPVPAAPHRDSPSATSEAFRGSAAEDRSVEIHIGRVEVLAVAPPAQRAPAASGSRTTSLTDYLARRNGRTR
jgi:hypothetical protein